MASNMIHITEDVLRAMANLNANREPNWIEIKKWLEQSRAILKSMAAFSVDVPSEKRMFFSGLAWAINDLSVFAEDPKPALEAIKIAREIQEKKLSGVG